MAFRNVTVNSISSPKAIGDLCLVSCHYEHMGEATSDEILYVAIGNNGFWGFDEILHDTCPRTISAHSTWTKIWGSVLVRLTSAIDPNDSPYDVYCKIGGEISPAVENVLVVSGGTQEPPQENFQNLIITGYTTPVDIGSSCQVQVRFEYQGPAQTLQLYSALGNHGMFGFDEIVAGNANLTVPETANLTAMTRTVSVPITSSIDPNDSPYDLYAKISGKINSPVYQNIVTVSGGISDPTFQNLRVMEATTPVKHGEICQVTVAFEYQGIAQSLTLYAAIGNDGAFGFDEILQGQTTISVPLSTGMQTVYRTVNINITAAIDPNDSPYDLYAKFIGGNISPTAYNVVYVTGDPVPPNPEFRNYQITNYTTPVGPGDICQVELTFEYQGPAQSVEVYAAIGNDGMWGFDEVLNASVLANLPATISWQSYTKTVQINITAGLSEDDSPYDMYAKVDGHIGPILQNVLAVKASAGDPEYQNMTIPNYDSPVAIGGVCRIGVKFDYRGPATVNTLRVAIGNNGIFGFDEIVHKEISINLPATDEWTQQTHIVSVPVVGLSLDDSPYDLYAKLGGTFPDIEAPILNDAVGIEGGGPGSYDIVGALTNARPLTFDIGSEVNILISYSAYTDDLETQISWQTRVVIAAGSIQGQTVSDHFGAEADVIDIAVVAGTMPEAAQTGMIRLDGRKEGDSEWSKLNELPVTINVPGSGEEPGSGTPGWTWAVAGLLVVAAVAGSGDGTKKSGK